MPGAPQLGVNLEEGEREMGGKYQSGSGGNDNVRESYITGQWFVEDLCTQWALGHTNSL